MAIADSTPFVDRSEDGAQEAARARALAERYRLEFIDMEQFPINQELFRSIPADLMLRYGFVPFRRDGKTLVSYSELYPTAAACDEALAGSAEGLPGQFAQLDQMLATGW